MLKSKKGIYILLPLVIFIWGGIVYQILDAFSGNDPMVNDIEKVTFSEIKTVERQQFSIGNVERDPFLGMVYQPKKNIVKTSVVKRKQVVWPSINYKGLVSGERASNTVFLVQINGTDQLLKRNESFEGVKLIQGSSMAIRLRYKGKTKRIEIQN